MTGHTLNMDPINCKVGAERLAWMDALQPRSASSGANSKGFRAAIIPKKDRNKDTVSGRGDSRKRLATADTDSAVPAEISLTWLYRSRVHQASGGDFAHGPRK